MFVFPSIRVKGVDEMKKISILLVLLVLTVIIALFPACSDDYEFEFSYESDRSVYLVGETVKITAKVTNVSGRTYRWKYGPFVPYVRLYPQLDDGTLGDPIEQFPYLAIEYKPENHKAKDDESGEKTVSFPIPEDAPIGKYTVVLSFDGYEKVFADAIKVIRPAEQNENEKYRYSLITAACGEVGVHPIKCALSSTHYVNGEARETGCSDGVWYLFNNPGTDPKDFPTLVLNGKVELYVPTHTIYNERLTLYGMDYEMIEYSGDLAGLSELPAGEYLVVFSEYESGEVWNPQDYWKSHWENVFKLIVRS